MSLLDEHSATNPDPSPADQSANDFLHFAVEAAELGLFDLNPQTGKFKANNRTKSLFGLADESEIELSRALVNMDENEREKVANAIGEALRFGSGGHYNIEYKINNPSLGTSFVVRAKGKVTFDDNQQPVRFTGTIQDVTEQVAARKKVEDNERLLNALVQNSPVRKVFLSGRNMNVVIANDEVLGSWGKDQSVIGKPLREILPSLEGQGYFETLETVFDTGVPFTKKSSLVSFSINGHTQDYYFDLWYIPLKDESGTTHGILTTAFDVTEKVITEKAIAESEHRLRNLVESVPFPIGVYTGQELRILLANQSILDIWGKGNDVVGKLYTEVLPELENQKVYEQLREVIRTGKPFEARNTRLELLVDGQMREYYFNYNFTPLLDRDRKVYGLINTAADVTDLNKAKKQVEESENNLRNIILQAPVAMAILKGQQHIVDIANSKMFELWGKNSDSMQGKPLLEGLPEIKGQGFEELLNQVLNTGTTFRAFDVLVYLDYGNGNEEHYVDFVYEAFRDTSGAISGVMVLVVETTEKVIAREKLTELEAKSRLAIESAELGSYEVNLTNNMMTTSERFDEIWGIGPNPLRSDIAAVIHPEDAAVREAAHKKSTETGYLEYEARTIHQDQSQHWVKVKGKVIFDDKMQPVNLLGVVQDITEQKEFAEQLKKQVKERTVELYRSNEDLLHFAHVASHDLKEPTRKIKFFGNMLADELGGQLPQKGKFYLDKILNATDRMFSMIEGVLTYSALRASEQPIEKIDLNQTIESICHDLEVLIEQKNATLHCGPLPEVEGASVLIYQLFYNLINNALKFSKKEIPSEISISASLVIRDNIQYAQIVLRDNGIGFEETYIQQIFNPFTRLNAKDQYEGTGLGLALCKKIAERHRGSITAFGVPGEFAQFTVELPLKQLNRIV